MLFADPEFAGKDFYVEASLCDDRLHNYSDAFLTFTESGTLIRRFDQNEFGYQQSSYGLGDRASSLIVYNKALISGLYGAELTDVGRSRGWTRWLDGGTCEFTRQFFPIPLPQTSACYNLTRGWNREWLLLHGAFKPDRVVKVILYNENNCKGEAIAFPDPIIDRRTFKLQDYHWENRPLSIAVILADPTAPKVAAAVQWVPEPPAWEEKNRKRTGSPVLSYWTSDSDPDACRKACSAEGYCKSYSFAPFAKMTAVETGTFAKPEPHHCVLNRDVPRLEREDGNVSGVKSYTGATTLRFEKPTLNGELIRACSEGKECDKMAALPYCQAQGLAWVESAHWVGRGHFDQIICTNIVRAEAGPPGSPGAPVSAGPAAVLPSGVSVGLARCEQYAKVAVQQQKDNVALQCGFQGPEWSDDYQRHHDWCAEVEAQESGAGTKLRELALDACRKAQDRPTQCDAYAKSALQDQQDNLAWGCGYEGPAWSSDHAWHYNWCMQVNAAQSDAGSAVRKEALNQCKK